MDYKKKYENALEWARQVINGECGFIRKDVEEVFPELKESEDERIRKGMLQGFKDYGEPEYVWWEGVKVKECIAWLEKQNHDGKKWIYEDVYLKEKEQLIQDGIDEVLENPQKYGLEKQGEKPQGKTALEAIKREKVDNANKVEPKFNVGDWIVDKSGLTQQVLDFRGGIYTCTYNSFTTDCESNYHLWSINDPKDGEILVCGKNKRPFIFKGLLDELHPNKPVAYCGINCIHSFEVSSDDYSWWTDSEVQPATKEQHNLLFSKMKEAGWSWDSETKELSQSKVTKISDKDGMATDIAIKAINHNTVNDSQCKENCKGYQETGKYYADWDCEAKRKAEQNLDWSEEDEELLNSLIKEIESELKKPYFKGYDLICNKKISWLKSLKERIGG